MKERNNQEYKSGFNELFDGVRSKCPSLCGYFLFGSLKNGSDSPSDIDAVYLYDSEIKDLSSEKRIQILDDLEELSREQLGVPINRYDVSIYDESESAFADISGNDFELKVGYLHNYFPNLKLEDFKVNEKARKKLELILERVKH